MQRANLNFKFYISLVAIFFELHKVRSTDHNCWWYHVKIMQIRGMFIHFCGTYSLNQQKEERGVSNDLSAIANVDLRKGWGQGALRFAGMLHNQSNICTHIHTLLLLHHSYIKCAYDHLLPKPISPWRNIVVIREVSISQKKSWWCITQFSTSKYSILFSVIHIFTDS